MGCCGCFPAPHEALDRRQGMCCTPMRSMWNKCLAKITSPTKRLSFVFPALKQQGDNSSRLTLVTHSPEPQPRRHRSKRWLPRFLTFLGGSDDNYEMSVSVVE